MKTTAEKQITVAFHIGRGGRFNNQGHLRYMGEMNIASAINLCDNSGNNIFRHNKDAHGKFCKPYYADHNGNHLIDEAEIATGVGTLNFDNDYDTVYCKHIGDCDEIELQLIADNTDYKSYEVQQYLKEKS
jgi:hypothetical protein